MKLSRYLKVAVLAIPFVMGSCFSKKKVVEEPRPVAADAVQQQDFLQQVNNNVQTAKFITSKVKFSVEVGNQQLTLTGNLRMKRDDVIRLQLMAFGFVEAGRLEFTKDYVLIMDRINKQYLKATYGQLDFLRNSGINFYTLQALFWNELFQPGRARMTEEALGDYQATLGEDDVVISYENGKMNYKWLATKNAAQIRMANIVYKDKLHGTTQLNWDYEDFKRNGKQLFPMRHGITFTAPEKEVKLGMVLNYMGAESDWETRTQVSNKYREVTVDEILRRFMSL